MAAFLPLACAAFGKVCEAYACRFDAVDIAGRALEADANTNILSTPNLLTLDNEEAKIVVGQNVPFITGTYTPTSGSATNPFQTIERKDIGMSVLDALDAAARSAAAWRHDGLAREAHRRLPAKRGQGVTGHDATRTATILVNAGGGSAGEDGAARVSEALAKAGIHGKVEEVDAAVVVGVAGLDEKVHRKVIGEVFAAGIQRRRLRD